MTVQQLIDQLQQLDPDLRVFTKGYEGGFEDAKLRESIYDFKLHYHSDWYYGPHEIVEENGDVKGIVL
jgi:hypothetical protein